MSTRFVERKIFRNNAFKCIRVIWAEISPGNWNFWKVKMWVTVAWIAVTTILDLETLGIQNNLRYFQSLICMKKCHGLTKHKIISCVTSNKQPKYYLFIFKTISLSQRYPFVLWSDKMSESVVNGSERPLKYFDNIFTSSTQWINNPKYFLIHVHTSFLSNVQYSLTLIYLILYFILKDYIYAFPYRIVHGLYIYM